MKYDLKNSRGQIVGQYNDRSKTYITFRNKLKGEIFIKKNYFNGVYIETPIAIDEYILGKLIEMGCERVEIVIIGIEKLAFKVIFEITDIRDKGIPINYDKRNEYGINVTAYGRQIVFDLKWGYRGLPEPKQTNLNYFQY